MSERSSYNLQPLWDAILDVYEEIRKVCERNDLRFYVAFGTAIGALRHQGFIPWDDDFDLYMPRADYKRFIKIAEQELPSYLRWHSIENDPKHHLPFGKVQDERQDVLSLVAKESNLNLSQGIFVDIFPLDGMPATKLGIYLWNIRRSLIRRAIESRKHKLKVANVFYKFASGFLPRFDNHRAELLYLQNWISQWDFDSCKKVGWCLSITKFPRFIKERAWFDGVKYVKFANTSVPVHLNLEEDLSRLYGDWRKLPPEEKRKPTHTMLVR